MLGGAASHPSEERRWRMWQDVLIRTRGVKQQRGEETPAFTSGVRVKVDLINCCTLNFFFFLLQRLKTVYTMVYTPKTLFWSTATLWTAKPLRSTGTGLFTIHGAKTKPSAFKHHTKQNSGPIWISINCHKCQQVVISPARKKWTLPSQIVLFELFMEAWRGQTVW